MTTTTLLKNVISLLKLNEKDSIEKSCEILEYIINDTPDTLTLKDWERVIKGQFLVSHSDFPETYLKLKSVDEEEDGTFSFQLSNGLVWRKEAPILVREKGIRQIYIQGASTSRRLCRSLLKAI